MLVVVVQVVDDGTAVDVLVALQATSSVHGSENIVAMLVVAALVIATEETGYG